MKLVIAKNEIFLSSGRTVAETEEEAQKIIDKLVTDAFCKGIPMYYKNDRTKSLRQFIRANPDGSEDLVSFDSVSGEYTLLSKFAPAGKGRWSYALNVPSKPRPEC